jgi:hypothetical protein
MSLSTARRSRLMVLAIGLLLLVTSLAPAIVSAGNIEGGTNGDASLVSSQNGLDAVIAEAPDDCPNLTPSKGEHHIRPS